MKKIGIFTYHSYDNYGAVLQAYALQTYISEKLNEQVEIIDFCTDEQLLANDILHFKRRKSLRLILSALYHKLPIFNQLKKRRRRFDLFRIDHLHLSQRFKDSKSLINNLPLKDVYIAGSDQVFNPYAKYTDVYYLGFKKNNAKKVAYAPSFGVTNLEESVDSKLQSLLRDFDYLSCREQVGADYLSKLLGRNVPCVADPVFLLTKEEWNTVIRQPLLKKSYNRGYIFVYRLNGGPQLMKLAQKLLELVNLPIICVATDFFYNNRYKVDSSAGPSEFLGLIRDASYVVTDSFHGTALSLVFGVKVIPYIAFPQASSRITNIMNRFGLSQNIVYNVGEFDFDSLNFGDYFEQMDIYINDSKKFLHEALN